MQPHFAIGWVLTWFAHDVDNWDAVYRIYDSCLASHPIFSVYLSAAVSVPAAWWWLCVPLP